MAGKKKDFTTADGAIDKMFSSTTLQSNDKQTVNEPFDTHVSPDENATNNINDINHAYVLHDDNYTDTTNVSYNKKPTHVSKHYVDRGKRDVRMALLLDEQLREDLNLLYKATNSKSLNDLIITILLSYVESDENQAKLKQYRKLLGI